MAQYLRSISSESMVAGKIYSMQIFGTLNELPTTHSPSASSNSHEGAGQENCAIIHGKTSFFGSRLEETDGLVARGGSELKRSRSTWDVSLVDSRHACAVHGMNAEDHLSADQLLFVGSCRPRAFAFIAHEDPSSVSPTGTFHSIRRPAYVVQASIVRSVDKWKYFRWRLRRAWNSFSI